MDRNVWDPSSELTGSAPAGNPGSDPFAPSPAADPWATSAQPTVAWGDEPPTVVWPWGVEPSSQQPVTWGSPPAPGAMEFPAAEPLPAAEPFSAEPSPAAPQIDFGPRFAAPDPFAPPVRPSPKAPGNRRTALVAGAVLVVLLGGAGGIGLALRGGNDDPAPAGTTVAQDQAGGGGQSGNGGQATTTPATPDTTEPTTPPTTSPPPSPTTDVQAEALAELEQIYEQDHDSVSFDGQYVAQIASKYPGITDKLQTTANGSHRFQASDILAEFKELRTGHGSSAHPVVLLKSTDYGKRQLKDGHFLWVTFALGDFPTSRSVTNWCNTEFSDLPPTERANQCAFRRLQPPQ
jgi:hypothetical protein